jgi:hypothetical protein
MHRFTIPPILRKLIGRTGPAALLLALLASGSAIAQDGSGVDETRVGRGTIDWDARLAHASPKADQPIYVIVHSAVDCKFCQRWKGRFSGEGELRRWASDHPMVKLVVIERPLIAGAETEAMYPPELLPLFEKRSASGTLRTGVPLFEAAMGQRIVYRTYGYSSWARKMFPAVQAIESRRGAPAADTTAEKD